MSNCPYNSKDNSDWNSAIFKLHRRFEEFATNAKIIRLIRRHIVLSDDGYYDEAK